MWIRFLDRRSSALKESSPDGHSMQDTAAGRGQLPPPGRRCAIWFVRPRSVLDLTELALDRALVGATAGGRAGRLGLSGLVVHDLADLLERGGQFLVGRAQAIGVLGILLEDLADSGDL